MPKHARIIIPAIIAIIIIFGMVASASYLFSSSPTAPSFANAKSFTPESFKSPVTDYKPDNHKHKNETFGCEESSSVICRPMLSTFNSYTVPSKAEKVYSSTSDIANYGNGITGRALLFNAYYEDYVQVENISGLNVTNFSVAFWIKKDPDDLNPGHAISFSNRANTAGWFFDIVKPSTQSVGFKVTNNNGTVFIPGEVKLGNGWTHVVGTFDGTFVKLYVNGILEGTANYTGAYNPNPNVALRFGQAAYCFSCAPWGGLLDDLYIFNGALTVNEVKQLFESYHLDKNGNSSNNTSISVATSVTSSSVIGHWTFNGNLLDTSSSKRVTLLETPAAGMVFSPDGRLFFTEKNTGKIRIMLPNDTVLAEPFATVPDLNVNIMYGLLGITVDPNFAQNHYVYVYYTTTGKKTGGSVDRVVRYTDEQNKGSNMFVVLDNIPAFNGWHSGGAIAFAPDGKLYISVGDGRETTFALDPNIWLGKVLRINSDGSIPRDNPGPNSPVYAIGTRNIYGLAFDTTNKNTEGDPLGIAADNGEALYDQIVVLHKGGNYGWPLLRPADLPPELQDNGAIKPVRTYYLDYAPTEVAYYDGGKYAELKGMFLIGSYNDGDIYSIQLDANGKHVLKEYKITPDSKDLPIFGLARSPNGDIYFGSHYIYKISSIDFANIQQWEFPIQLKFLFSSQVSANSPPSTSLPTLLSSASDFVTKKVDLKQNIMTIDIDPQGHQLLIVSIMIPRSLADGIVSVSQQNMSASKQDRQGGNGFVRSDQTLTPDYILINAKLETTSAIELKMTLLNVKVLQP